MSKSPESPKCPKCGAKLAEDSPGGLCVACLLKLGFDLPLITANYRIVEKLGEGGCGIVYRSEQLAPVRRHVALKVIKLGMDTKAVIARFEAERQVLALMNHPNIAKVYDAGATSAGRPY